MTRNNAAFTVLAMLVLLSAGLNWLVMPCALLLAGFVGVNMLRSGIAGLCPTAAAFGTDVLKAAARSTPTPSWPGCTLGSGPVRSLGVRAVVSGPVSGG